VQLAVLPTVAFVHQREDVRVIVAHGIPAHRSLKLIDDRGDDLRLVAGDEFSQVPARLRLLGLSAAMPKGPVNLVVQVHAIGHQDDLEIVDAGFHGDGITQHDHRQRLATTLSVPHDTALAPAVVISRLDAIQDLLDAEVLLVPGHLLLAGVKQREPEHEFQQAVGAAEGVNAPVLSGDLSAVGFQGVEVAANVLETTGEQPGLLVDGKRLVHQGHQVLVGVAAFFPYRPELGRSSGGAILRFILRQG